MKKISKIWSVFNIILLIGLIAAALVFGFPLYIAIALTALYSFIILLAHGYPLRPMRIKIISNVQLVSKVLLLLSMIGLLIPMLFEIGAMPNFIYVAITSISKANILLFAFLTSIILSMLLGTALGTMTILAPLLIGVAHSIGLPLPYLVGALVSGAYFGDRSSPLSSAMHLTASVTRTEARENIRLLLKGSVLPLIISSIAFYLLGRPYVLSDISQAQAIQSAIAGQFQIHWLYLTPFILLILLILLRVPILRSISIVYSMGLAYYISQGFQLERFLSISLNGYQSHIPELSMILKSTGLQSMFSLFLVIIFSAVLNSFLEIGRLLDHLVEPYLKNIKDYRQLTLKSALLSTILSLITCNQTLTSIVTGNYMNPYYDRIGVSRSYLAKTIGDTGLNVVGLIPWNVNGLLIMTLTGVPTLSYAPYVFFAITLFISSTWIQPMFFKDSDNSSQEIN